MINVEGEKCGVCKKVLKKDDKTVQLKQASKLGFPFVDIIIVCEKCSKEILDAIEENDDEGDIDDR